MAGDFGGGVRLECAVRGSGARGEGFGAEFWGGVVADLDAWFMLGRGVSWYRGWLVGMGDAHAGGGEGLVTRAGGVEFALVGDGVRFFGGHCCCLMLYVVDLCD